MRTEGALVLLVLATMFLCAATPGSPDRWGAPPDLFTGPQEGERAPKFSLKDLRGQEVRLEQFKGKRPIVLVTGSYSCPIYRKQLSSLEKLYEKYRKRAAFFILYTIEAHPKGQVSPYAGREWVTEENEQQGILVRQPSSYEERLNLASRCQQALRSNIPILVDEMDNAVWEAYGKAPNAAYLIDSKGKVRVRQGWFEPLSFETALLEELQEEPG